jgi:hypothetical protein
VRRGGAATIQQHMHGGGYEPLVEQSVERLVQTQSTWVPCVGPVALFLQAYMYARHVAFGCRGLLAGPHVFHHR